MLCCPVRMFDGFYWRLDNVFADPPVGRLPDECLAVYITKSTFPQEETCPEKRRSIHVDGVAHSMPIPMGSLVGNVLFSSGIAGTDPATGAIPDDIEQQCDFAFANMKTLVGERRGYR